MPEMTVDFEVYCGNCKSGVCFHTTVEEHTLTVTCPYCKEEIDNLKKENKLLKKESREAKTSLRGKTKKNISDKKVKARNSKKGLY